MLAVATTWIFCYEFTQLFDGCIQGFDGELAGSQLWIFCYEFTQLCDDCIQGFDGELAGSQLWIFCYEFTQLCDGVYRTLMVNSLAHSCGLPSVPTAVSASGQLIGHVTPASLLIG